MASMTDFLENKLIDFLFRAQALGIGGATAAAAPADGAAGTEVTGGAYARVAVTSALANWAGTQAAASAVASSGATGTTSNNAVITYPVPTANWGSIVSMAIYDAAAAGNMLIHNALTTPKTVNNGDPAPTFPAATLSFQIDN
jgi:hypothetical protein